MSSGSEGSSVHARRCRTRVATALALATAAVFAGTGPVRAAPYTVIQCDSAYSVAHDWSFGTFHPATFYGEDRCGSGSVLAVRARPYTSAPANFGGNWSAVAPDWTVFTRFQADFQGGSNGSSQTAPEVYMCGDIWCTTWKHFIAWGNGGDSGPIPGVPGWDSPGTRSWTGYGGRVVRFGLGCAFGDCAISRWGAGIDMFGPRFQLDDQAGPNPPSFGVPGGWRRGTVQVSYSASDRGSGVRQVHLYSEGGVRRGTDTRGCATAGGVYTRLVPCPLGTSGALSADTSAMTDGTHQLNVLVEDASGQGTWGGAQTVRVDNHAPTAPTSLAVAAGDGWRSANGFTISWTNPSGQHAPLVRAHYTLCKVGGACVPSGARTAPNPTSLSALAVPSAGDWLLRLHLEDEAGNADSGHPSEPVHLRFDPDPPERVEFEPSDPEDPQRISVAVADATSGIAGGQIELRPEAGGPWSAVPTRLDGSHLVGQIDDAALAPGFYEFRATARDYAGNERSSQDGPQSRKRVYLPVRLRSRVALRAVRPSCETPRSPAASQARKCGAGFIGTRRGAVRLRFGGRALVLGQVETVDGVAIRGGTVDILFRHRATDRSMHAVGQVATDADGAFSYVLPRGPSGTYRFRYAGSARFGPGSGELAALVRARVTFRASKRRARNGDTVTFSGRLVGRPVPALGRTLDVQAWVPGFGWRTFATPRTDRRGRFAVPYTFRFTRGVQRYRIRALVERSGDYPYERAVSRVVRVRVRGP